ncbi:MULTISPECIES: hypothetical protein [Brucella/Ochrobactrum group]|nr:MULTISPECIES: hypothetical protein [Brucella/Ochrobactrum group]KAB2725365.1 hypothetical protein F9K90_23460 [Brucella anthropi]KAB2746363.1 hypothetical protein F9K95_22830 [Brucella anthropi]KAB2749190.1 hypothetical protein F9L05_12170 [Brucella anthropi]KAB2761662.1 hypothetical protein F9K98_15170 [Brucella anthropi]KAB2775196.1 hypothetical protein F9K99_22895 [Brucella anthropi]
MSDIEGLYFEHLGDDADQGLGLSKCRMCLMFTKCHYEKSLNRNTRLQNWSAIGWSIERYRAGGVNKALVEYYRKVVGDSEYADEDPAAQVCRKTKR